ncbi:MAG TPA: MMPL family transporter [Solirubrobacteraceae bacterium]|nr:MMPL family transporter [Solirubrobacteraceae bacterium]
MNTARFFSALVGGAGRSLIGRRPWVTIAVLAALALGGATLALGLSPSADTSTFVSSSSSQYRATQRYFRSFGEEPVSVVVQGSLQQLLLSSDIDRLVGLEGCLSGNVPASALATEGGTRGPCGQLAKAGTVKVVLGPGTFVNEAAEQIDEQLTSQTKQAEAQAHAARQVVARAALAHGHSAAEAQTLGAQASSITMARFQEGIAMLALQYGLTSKPSLENPSFVSTLVFDPKKPAGTPKQRFAYLFPSPDAALISVRMQPGLSAAARAHTIALIGRAVAMQQWRLAHGETYLVTGEPAIVSDLTSSISRSIELLGLAVLVVMAIALSLIFRGRPRLLPLAVAMLATALTFGVLSLISSSLTVAQVAVLPVLVGLAVDYAVQFQSRAGEILAAGAPSTRAAVREAARVSAPTIATAVAASAAATLVLVLSPVPMVRGFGELLAGGIVIAFACALTVGSAALVVAGRSGSGSSSGGSSNDSARGVSHGVRSASVWRRARVLPESAGRRARESLAPAWRGARELLTDNPLTRFISWAALDRAVRHPGRVLGAGLVLAMLGWGLDTQTKVQTNIEKLVPQNTASLRNLHTLERLSGVGGVIALTISGADVVQPATIEWMSAYESAMLERFGYTANRGCGRARLCPAFSLPDLFNHQGAKSKLKSAEVNGLLDAIPPYFSQDVIAPGRRLATLAFGIKLMSLDEQQRVIEAMRASLHPPRGVSAQLVGLSVLAAQANAQIASPWRRMQTLLIGLAAVALVLLIAFAGDVRRTLTPLTPIVLASGWSALILFVVRVPLNPMSLALGALVIAIATEFSVLLSERHRQERLAGSDVVQALLRTYRHTGAAVAASGVTAIMGFGVLVLSDIAMLRDFGLVTLIDLSVSLVGVLVALPAALVLSERSWVGVGWPTLLPLRWRRARHEPT